MTTREKALAKMRNNPRGVRFEELTKVLEWYGFELRQVRGSHYAFVRGHQNLIVARRTPHVRTTIVKQVLQAIAELQDEDE